MITVTIDSSSDSPEDEDARIAIGATIACHLRGLGFTIEDLADDRLKDVLLAMSFGPKNVANTARALIGEDFRVEFICRERLG